MKFPPSYENYSFYCSYFCLAFFQFSYNLKEKLHTFLAIGVIIHYQE